MVIFKTHWLVKFSDWDKEFGKDWVMDALSLTPWPNVKAFDDVPGWFLLELEKWNRNTKELSMHHKGVFIFFVPSIFFGGEKIFPVF